MRAASRSPHGRGMRQEAAGGGVCNATTVEPAKYGRAALSLGANKGGFRTKREGEADLATVEVSKLQSGYIAPGDAQVTVAILGLNGSQLTSRR